MVSAINIAATGLFKTQQDFNKSAVSFINSFTPTLAAASGDVGALENITQVPTDPQVNPFAGNQISGDTLIAASTAQLFSPDATDPAQTLGNLILDQTSFLANIYSFSSISETEQELLNILA